MRTMHAICNLQMVNPGDEIQICYVNVLSGDGEIATTAQSQFFAAKVICKFNTHATNDSLLVGWDRSTQIAHRLTSPSGIRSRCTIMNVRTASLLLTMANSGATLPASFDYFLPIYDKTVYFFKFQEENQSPIIQPRLRARDGMDCQWCDNFFPMAEANQQDGSLKCYSCRSAGRISKLPRYSNIARQV